MRNRLALLVVTVAAIGLVLTGCGSGPGTDKMMPSIDGTWVFHGFSAVIAVPDVTVTVGDGTTPLGPDPLLATVTQIVAKGKLTAVAGTTYKLALAEGDDAISVTLAAGASPASEALAIGFTKGLIGDAQDGDVDITVSDDMMMITVKGSFLTKLAQALGVPEPEEGLVGCKDAPCSTTAS